MVFPSIEGALCYFDEYVSTDDGDAVGSSLLFGTTTNNNFTLCSSSRDVEVTATTTTTPRINITNKTIETVLNNNKENNTNSSSSRVCPPDLTEASSSSDNSPSNRSSTKINSLFDDEVDDDENVVENHLHIQEQPQQHDKIEFAVLSSYHNKRPKSPRSGCCVDLDDVDDDNNNNNSNNNVDVLTRNIMSQLQDHLPISKRGESFWLKYSMVHDGAALSIMLDKVAGCDTTVLAIETIDGDVFGAFCTAPWKIQQDGWYGNGSDTFLWRLQETRGSISSSNHHQHHHHIRRKSKDSVPSSLIDDDSDDSDNDDECEQRDSSPVTAPKEEGGSTNDKELSQPDGIHEPIEVFKFTFWNHNVQQCNQNRLMIGGGHKTTSTTTTGSAVCSGDGSSTTALPSSSFALETKWGYGLSLDQDLLKGSTSSCLTYDSPSLISSSNIQNGGGGGGGGGGCSIFEVRNLEVWALTPFVSLEEAKRSYDRKRRFL